MTGKHPRCDCSPVYIAYVERNILQELPGANGNFRFGRIEKNLKDSIGVFLGYLGKATIRNSCLLNADSRFGGKGILKCRSGITVLFQIKTKPGQEQIKNFTLLYGGRNGGGIKAGI